MSYPPPEYSTPRPPHTGSLLGAPPVTVTPTYDAPTRSATAGFPTWIKVVAVVVTTLKALPLAAVALTLFLAGSLGSAGGEFAEYFGWLLDAVAMVVIIGLAVLTIQMFSALSSRRTVFLVSAGLISLIDAPFLLGIIGLLAESRSTFAELVMYIAVIVGQFVMVIGAFRWKPDRITTR
ncbi:MAG: hypothetical protein R2706_06500 [Acidimicrobiales bacterium]